MRLQSQDRKDLRGAASAALGTEIPYLEQYDLKVWGIDLNSRTMNLAILSGKASPLPHHHSIEPVEPLLATIERVHTMYARCRWLFESLAHHQAPAAIAIELPVGRHPAPILTQMMGAILSALGETVGPQVIYDQPTPTDWKLTTIGKGNATKPDVHEWYLKAFDHHAPALKAPTEDDMDAAAIATDCRLWMKGAS